jgi:hypothetical protein
VLDALLVQEPAHRSHARHGTALGSPAEPRVSRPGASLNHHAGCPAGGACLLVCLRGRI